MTTDDSVYQRDNRKTTPEVKLGGRGERKLQKKGVRRQVLVEQLNTTG